MSQYQLSNKRCLTLDVVKAIALPPKQRPSTTSGK